MMSKVPVSQAGTENITQVAMIFFSSRGAQGHFRAKKTKAYFSRERVDGDVCSGRSWPHLRK